MYSKTHLNRDGLKRSFSSKFHSERALILHSYSFLLYFLLTLLKSQNLTLKKTHLLYSQPNYLIEKLHKKVLFRIIKMQTYQGLPPLL